MKTKQLFAVALLILSGIGVGNTQVATNGVSALLQKGLLEEEANRNLEAAITAYQAVVAQTEKDRQFAATAVFRLGECYRKLGRTNEANVQYQRILREFSDQTELAKLSQQNLGTATTIAASTNIVEGMKMQAARMEAQELERIKAMIKDSPDLINAVGEGGSTPLHKAVSDRRVSVIKFLLENKADPNSTVNSGMTPLTMAVERGDRDIVELLLNGKADPNIASSIENGAAPIHMAVSRGFKSIVEVLIGFGAKVNAKNQYGKTALHLAAEKGFKSIVEVLLAKGAEVDARDGGGATPLDSAISFGNRAVAEFLLANKADPNSKTGNGRYYTPLMFAVAANNLDVAKLLIERGADVDANASGPGRTGTCTALHQAVYLRRIEMVKLLLEKGAKRDERLSEMSYPVLSPQTIGSVSGWTPLMLAMLNTDNDPETAKLLLEAKADPNAGNADAVTPLMLAASRGNPEMIALLLANHADPNLQDKWGKTALGYAVTAKSARPSATGDIVDPESIVEMLRKAGANENLQRLSNIGVSRSRNNYSEVVAIKGSNSFNRPTLYEILAGHYCPPIWRPRNVPGGSMSTLNEVPGYVFPDFAKIQISRLQKDGKTNIIKIDVEAALNTGDCAKDVPLEWGDIVEIPESVHNVKETWTGLTPSVAETLQKCLERKVDVVVRGTTNRMTLKPLRYVLREMYFIASKGMNYDGQRFGAGSRGFPGFQPDTSIRTELPSFWLYDVVTGANVILTSSDLTRVKVKRVNAATRKTEEMSFNLEQDASGNPLMLKDGDVIELPDRD